jgi:selenocysteine lyase/cysteine desulfurase
VLGLRIPSALEDRWHLSRHIPADQRPVVFIGPYEHHSNEIPWRESVADVVTIREDADGEICQETLRAALEEYADRPLKIGSFSAASNVTGIVSDTHGISTVLHEHGALAFWDFAAAGPYVDIEMTAPEGGDPRAYKDAIFLSPHKFIGGPATPGVLVARRQLFTNRVPVVPGGGTVAYVNPEDHAYLADPAHREEGGTPAIIEAVRAGLVFQLKEAVGAGTIRAREERFLRRAVEAWSHEPTIEILGNLEAPRLSIVSFVVRSPSGSYLHHNFVVAVLNDLFGIQSRGGCSCAGPYGHRLLGIDLERSHEFEREITGGCEGIKPGWVRVNFNYFISDTVADYVVEAVRMVARDGWRLLGDYVFDPVTGRWRHRAGVVEPPIRLGEVRYGADGAVSMPSSDAVGGEEMLADQLREAAAVLAAATPPVPGHDRHVSVDFEHLRWFDLPEGCVVTPP